MKLQHLGSRRGLEPPLAHHAAMPSCSRHLCAQIPPVAPACRHSTHNLTLCRAEPQRASAAAAGSADTLRQARFGVAVDPAYTEGAVFLKSIGINNPAEIAKVLDIAMNPNSLFLDASGKRGRNASARSLSVDKDMRPVVDFLTEEGMSSSDLIKVVSGHPPVLSYSVETRLRPFWAYLKELGVQDVNAAVVSRPTILGLDVDANLRKIVGYLQSVDTPPETIVKYLVESI